MILRAIPAGMTMFAILMIFAPNGVAAERFAGEKTLEFRMEQGFCCNEKSESARDGSREEVLLRRGMRSNGISCSPDAPLLAISIPEPPGPNMVWDKTKMRWVPINDKNRKPPAPSYPTDMDHTPSDHQPIKKPNS